MGQTFRENMAANARGAAGLGEVFGEADNARTCHRMVLDRYGMLADAMLEHHTRNDQADLAALADDVARMEDRERNIVGIKVREQLDQSRHGVWDTELQKATEAVRREGRSSLSSFANAPDLEGRPTVARVYASFWAPWNEEYAAHAQAGPNARAERRNTPNRCAAEIRVGRVRLGPVPVELKVTLSQRIAIPRHGGGIPQAVGGMASVGPAALGGEVEPGRAPPAVFSRWRRRDENGQLFMGGQITPTRQAGPNGTRVIANMAQHGQDDRAVVTDMHPGTLAEVIVFGTRGRTRTYRRGLLSRLFGS